MVLWGLLVLPVSAAGVKAGHPWVRGVMQRKVSAARVAADSLAPANWTHRWEGCSCSRVVAAAVAGAARVGSESVTWA